MPEAQNRTAIRCGTCGLTIGAAAVVVLGSAVELIECGGSPSQQFGRLATAPGCALPPHVRRLPFPDPRSRV